MYNQGVNIRDVVTRETRLKLIQNDFLEQCPFCGSGTGRKGTSAFSFHDNGYRCFSCDSKGDAIVFIEEYRNMGKAEAISYFKTTYKGESDNYNPFNYKVNNMNTVVTKKPSIKKKEDKFNTLGLWDIDIYDKNFTNDNFVKFLLSKFDNNKVKILLDKYDIRTTENGTIFPYIDNKGEIRTVKRIQYKPNGKMNREVDPFYLHKKLGGTDFKYKRCFFGEHLLPNNKGKVGIVESEKTAIIASIFMEDYVFLATGGKNLLHINNISNIYYFLHTDIVLFPDHDKPDSNDITPFIQWSLLSEKLHDLGYDIKVSDTLEGENIPFGYDIADVFINIHSGKVDKVDKVSVQPRPVLNLNNSKKRQSSGKVGKVDKQSKTDTTNERPVQPNTVLDDIQKQIYKSSRRHEFEKQKSQVREQVLQRLNVIKERLGEIDIPDHPVKVGILTYVDIPKSISTDIDIIERWMDGDYSEPPLRRLEDLVHHLSVREMQIQNLFQ